MINLAKVSLHQLRLVFGSLHGPHVLVCMADSAPNETMDGVPRRICGITELLDDLRCILTASVGPEHNVSQPLYWI